MNKKGLSLAQLLLVIVVMAVISLISFLLVQKTIENTKIKACQNEALIFYSSINNVIYTSLDEISKDKNNPNTIERYSEVVYPSVYCEDLGIRKTDLDKYYEPGNTNKFLNLTFYLQDGKLVLLYVASIKEDLVLNYEIINGHIYEKA